MKTLAVHLHIYYTDMLPKILQYLKNLEGLEYDLYVTMVTENKEVESKIKSFNKDADIKVVENRGYDIGPFIDFLHRIDLSNYKYILKVHTKGTKSNNYTHLNGNRLDNALWGRILWDSMLSSSSRIRDNIKELDKNDKAGMIGSAYCHTNELKDYQKLLPQINENLVKMGFSEIEKLSFIAGSMFLCRANLLQPLTMFKLDDFAPTDGKIKEGTLAHIVERLLCVIITSQNYKIKGIKHTTEKLEKIYDNYSLRFFVTSVCRFLFQKKVTRSGKRLIKICKIPVYSKQIES